MYSFLQLILELTESVSAPGLSWSIEYIDAINAEILSVCGEESTVFDQLILDSVSGSHRTRAVIAMLWCEAISGDYLSAVPIAAAYEVAHAAALVEDDIIDESREKHGSNTLSVKYGIPRALLVSNALLFYAPTFIAKSARLSEDSILVARLLDLLGNCGRLTARGEFLDLEMSQMSEVSVPIYEKMITMKTGALVGAASASGALVGMKEFDSLVFEAAYSFGESLGAAYQILDDLQDYLGEADQMGKPSMTDLRNRKISLPIIACLQKADQADRDFLKTTLVSHSPISTNEAERTKSLILHYGADKYCRAEASKFVTKAEASLSKLNENSSAKQRLAETIQFLSTRN